MDIINIFLVMTGIVNVLLGFLFLYHLNTNVRRIDIAFSSLVFTLALWAFLMGIFRVSTNPAILDLSVRFLYAIPIFIPAFFLYFILDFLKLFTYHRERLYSFFIFAPALLLALVVLFTHVIVIRAIFRNVGENIVFFGGTYSIYLLYIILFFAGGYFFLAREYFHPNESNIAKKQQIKVLFLGTFFPGTLSIFSNLLLPYFGIFSLNWVGPILTLFFIFSVLYAIEKYKLLNIKVITAQLLVFFIWIFIFFRFLFEQSEGQKLFDIGILSVAIIFGVFLVRGVKKEVLERERYEKINAQIVLVNQHLESLDRQKTEFISLASHQLRTPLTAVKGYASMLLEGSFGSLPKDADHAVHEIFEESENLAKSVENLLVVSRIEQGRTQYNFENIDLQTVVSEVFVHAKDEAQKKRLDMTFEKYGAKRFGVSGDREKLKQLISNLIYNAIRNTKAGFIRVVLVHDQVDELVRLSVSDTGRGMTHAELESAFIGFHDSKVTKNSYHEKKGMGLYISLEYAKAHKGALWGESPGLGKGSSFFFEMPYRSFDPKAVRVKPTRL